MSFNHLSSGFMVTPGQAMHRACCHELTMTYNLRNLYEERGG